MIDILYRIQDTEGRGPYRPGFSSRWADADGPIPPAPFFVEFGWPIHAVPSKFTKGWHGGCAFRTLKQLRNWFTETERMKLAALKFEIVRMTADRIIAESENQVVFECATPLRFGVVVLGWDCVEKWAHLQGRVTPTQHEASAVQGKESP